MRDVTAYLNGETASISMTYIDDSVNGHLLVYGAEEARKNHRVIEIDDLRK
jgi:hypothetical protein